MCIKRQNWELKVAIGSQITILIVLIPWLQSRSPVAHEENPFLG